MNLFDNVPLETQKGHYSLSPVRNSAELDRILKMPTWSDPPFVNLETLKRPGGKMTLRPLQVKALRHAFWSGGLFAPLGVGTGKTLLALLLPTLLDKKAVILCPAAIKPQFLKLAKEYDKHFLFRRDLHVVSTNKISVASGAGILEQLEPELIIADEAHNFANPHATRTKRFLRYFKARPETLFCALSGTITKRSLKDFGHLLELALGEGSPLPRDWATLTEWAEALDVTDRPRPAGALTKFQTDFARAGEADSVRKAWRGRLVSTMGVVASEESDVGSSLVISVIRGPKSAAVDHALKDLWQTWCRPDGEELVTALEMHRLDNQIRVGGFYRWVREPKLEWKEARATWHRQLREFLQKRSQKGLDSPLLVTKAIERGEEKVKHLKLAWTSWKFWKEIEPAPPVEWVWVDDAYLHAFGELVKGPAIIWVKTVEAGRALAKHMGVKWYGAGQPEIIQEPGTRTIVASISAHHKGHNLQAFSRSLVLQGPPTGPIWEQLIGRTHRSGQEADTVEVFVPDTFQEDLVAATRDAQFAQDSLGNQQRLLFATRKGW